MFMRILICALLLGLSSPAIANNLSSGTYTSNEVGVCMATLHNYGTSIEVQWNTINQDLYPGITCQYDGQSLIYNYSKLEQQFLLSIDKSLYIELIDNDSFIYGKKSLNGSPRYKYQRSFDY
tara:strand:+ start:59896 stop:60261 length:366 start_codon:yes stop_codon:yes gene_type:complete